jgi:hypothetical protein
MPHKFHLEKGEFMSGYSVTLIEQSLVEKMASSVTCSKPEVIMDRFGISVNTWSKIRNGKAIRQSVAMRLMERLKREQVI